MTMKLKVKITGPKVHNVGYRVFLLKHTMNTVLPGLSSAWKYKIGKEMEVIDPKIDRDNL
jgi:hypothetical protein